jgi:hypothetical protein
MELGREPYQSEVKETTDRELALLAEKSTVKKGKREANAASSAMYKQDIAALERRLDSVDEFVKLWGPKLHRWDSFIEELHDAEFAKEEDEGKATTNKKDNGPSSAKGTARREPLAERDSQKSSSESGSDTSNLDSGSDSEDKGRRPRKPKDCLPSRQCNSEVEPEGQEPPSIGWQQASKLLRRESLRKHRRPRARGRKPRQNGEGCRNLGQLSLKLLTSANIAFPAVSKGKEVRNPCSVY